MPTRNAHARWAYPRQMLRAALALTGARRSVPTMEN